MRQTFTIPLLPYLEKYVEKQFFDGLQAPYKIEEDSLLGKQFMSLIIDARSKDLRGDKKIEMTGELKVTLSAAMAKRSPTLLKLIPINYFLAKLFKHDMINWINCAESVGIRPFNSTKLFLQHYKIDESEYSHDAAYKSYQRFRSQGHKSHISAQQRPNLRPATSG